MRVKDFIDVLDIKNYQLATPKQSANKHRMTYGFSFYNEGVRYLAEIRSRSVNEKPQVYYQLLEKPLPPEEHAYQNKIYFGKIFEINGEYLFVELYSIKRLDITGLLFSGQVLAAYDALYDFLDAQALEFAET